MSTKKHRILVADDDPQYLKLMRLNLQARGYEVVIATDGRAAVEVAAAEKPDLILLDIKMPEMDGYEACRRIRRFSTVPVIMLTAMARDDDKVKGLDVGADDYLPKPFSMQEFLARVRAALRRLEFEAQAYEDSIFQTGDLRVDTIQQQVWVADREIGLTPIEYKLLRELVKEAGRVVETEQLLANIWGIDYAGADRALRQAIYRLRQKVEPDSRNPQYIQTRSGVGYLLALAE